MRALAAIVFVVTVGTAAAQERQVFLRQIITASPADIWKAWTTTEGVKSFLVPEADVDFQAGGKYELYLNPHLPLGSRGTEGMKVMASVPERMLSFSWNPPARFPKVRNHSTLVIVRISSTGGMESIVTLVHVGWPSSEDFDKAYLAASRFWPTALRNLSKRFESGPIDWTERLVKLKEEAEAPPAPAAPPKPQS